MRTDKSATSRDQYFHIAIRSKLGGNGKERKEEITPGSGGASPTKTSHILCKLRGQEIGDRIQEFGICGFRFVNFCECFLSGTGNRLIDDFAFADPPIRSTATPEF
jgi:hypothetical protein